MGTARERSWVADRTEGAVVSVLVSPKSGVNKLGQVERNELRIYVTAPPADGAANAAVVDVMAQAFAMPKSRIEIVFGHSSRHKRILFKGLSAKEVRALARKVMESS